MTQHKRALVISFSKLKSDPRVRKQIDWLTDSGWTVDTLGLGELPPARVADHFELGEQAAWVKSRIGAVFVYLLLPRTRRFALLAGNRIPAEAGRRVSDGEYSLILFNDFELIGWTKNHRVFTPAARRAHIHLDLHEYRDPRLPLTSAWRVVTSDYYRWLRRLIGDPLFTSRSTVASRLAEFYAEDFGFATPAIVRSTAPFIDQRPKPVDPERIRLVYHGMASWTRGLREIVDAMRLVDSRFEMTFMLTGNSSVIAELTEYASDLTHNTRFVPPVPMPDLSAVVNQYDLEIMLFRPTSRNLQFALPNKLFEAVQGRLGLVIGESPMMEEIVERYSNGVVVAGWTGADLAATLNALTVDEITGFKSASHRAAPELCSETERSAFLESIGASA